MQNVIGNVGIETRVLDVTLVTQASAYATGDVIGGKITLTGAMARVGGSGLLKSVQICSLADLTVDFDLILFSDDPTNTTFTENGAVAIATTDVAKILGVVGLTSRKDLGTPVVVSLHNIDMALKSGANSRDLYACLVARGTHTPASTADIVLRFGIQACQ